MDSSNASVSVITKTLRGSFRDDKTRSKEWRVNQLKALQTLLTEGRKELCDAMTEDLGKSAFEGYLTEINLVEHEIHGALSNIDRWMAPDTVSTNLFNIPAQSKVYHDPLGVVLVMGAWNYNVMLTLDPLVGAIAGGNCALVKPGSYASKSAEVMVRGCCKTTTLTPCPHLLAHFCLSSRKSLLLGTWTLTVSKLSLVTVPLLPRSFRAVCVRSLFFNVSVLRCV
jgi:acyl-CoA reductase-like NAD-dependent aldehyde dehydrogenase